MRTLLLFWVLLGMGCGEEGVQEPVDGGEKEEEFVLARPVMGTILKIRARGGDSRKGILEAFEEVGAISKSISNYDPDSPLSRLNETGGVEADERLAAFLTDALDAAERTKGACDLTVGALVRAWGFREKKPRVPDQATLDSLVLGWKNVQRKGNHFSIPKGMEIDPGAMGKGWTIDRVVSILRDHGVKEGVVDFGSTTFVFGRDWRIGIGDPFNPDAIIARMTIRDEALSISGGEYLHFVVDGKRYIHLLDPRTRFPVEGRASVAVVAPTAFEADVLSTAIFVDPSQAESWPALIRSDDPEEKAVTTPEWDARLPSE